MAAQTSSVDEITTHTHTWVASLLPSLAVYESGSPKGRSLAKQNLRRMAEMADLAFSAVKTIERMVAEEHAHGDDVSLVMAEARRLSDSRPADNSPEHHVAHSPLVDGHRSYGVLAKRMSNLELPLDVCYCARGFYLGTFCDAQPYLRESEEFWQRRELAIEAMRTGQWTQRTAP